MPDLGAMSPTWVLPLVLLAAALHATWNALVKAGGDRLAVQALVMLAPGLVAAPFLLFLPLPAAAALPFLVASVIIHIAYNGLLAAAYQQGDLSQVYPIARGSAPLLVALGGWLLAGETKTPAEMAAIAIVSLGILGLSLRRGPRRAGELRSVVLALLVGLSIASYSLADGLGARNAGSTLSYIAWLFFLEGTIFMVIVAYLRRGRLVHSFRPILLPGIGGGLMAGTAYAIVIWAMTVAPMAHVVALRETSVLMAAGIGAFILKEGFGAHRITASALVVTGTVLLQLVH
ncbi:DMT family transporter [Fodinicurvata sp. CAU 1616]|uniref:DMT family transporter n=2 Tax=Aquibaculum arenosum TaxID=3032591 RepID=A0ABT5YK78_9PROT|nr:DMT family transporter [Fodinicurvata sp. CAU 1616]